MPPRTRSKARWRSEGGRREAGGEEPVVSTSPSESRLPPTAYRLPMSGRFDEHRGGFAAADADGRNAALLSFLAQRVDERRQNAGAGGSDRMAQGDRPAADVDPRGVERELPDRGHRDRGEGLVDLEEVDVGDRESRLLQELLDGADGRRREPLGRLRDAGIVHDAGDGIEIHLPRLFLGSDDEWRRAVVDLRSVGRRHRAILLERRLESRDLLERSREGLLVRVV